jgi:predicted metal-dependent peptidase
MGSFDDTFNKVWKQLLKEAEEKPSEISTDKTISEKDFELTEKIIIWSKGQLFRKESVLFNILQNLKINITKEVDTMAVDNKRNIYINPDFTIMMYKRDPQEVVGVLAHETMHHANETFYRQKGREMRMWNVATDFVMNMYLLDSDFKLPKEGCIPVLENSRWIVTLPVAEGLSEEQAKQIRESSTSESQAKAKVGEDGSVTEIKIDITEVDAEQLYHYLKNVLPKKQNKTVIYLPETLDEHVKDGPKQEGKDGDEEEEGDDSEGFKPGQGKGEEGGGEAEKAEREKLREIISKAKIAGTHQKNTLGGGKDKGLGGSRELVRDWSAPVLDWKNILRRFVQKSQNTEYTWKTFNRRAEAAGYDAPGKRTTESKIETVIAVDCSGSISDVTVRKFVGSVIQMATQHADYNFRVILYSDIVFGDISITPQTLAKAKRQMNELKFVSGGNNENSIREYLNANKVKKVSGFLMLTDGYVDPSATYIDSAQKKLFLIIKGGTDKYLKKHGDTLFVNIDDL